ncbi:hypothetical protein AB0H00_25510 [Nocardia sp. NPDC023852]|uniref:hypothetical protein n=1 Tax=Nocardia sp. NPDC023852 TaxID=3154697 RepID=UPI0033E00102
MGHGSLTVDEPVAVEVRGRATVPRGRSSEVAVERVRISDTDPVDSANSWYVGLLSQVLEQLRRAASAGLSGKTIAALRQRLVPTTVAGSFSAQPFSSDLTITVRSLLVEPLFRCTERRRNFFRVLRLSGSDSAEWQSMADVLPIHCAPAVAELPNFAPRTGCGRPIVRLAALSSTPERKP